MIDHLTKEQLIELVVKIMNAEGTEEEIDVWEDALQRNVSHPEVSRLIFYPDREMTAEEIVEEALSYKPLILPAEDFKDYQ